MATKIVTKNSSTASAVPTASDLVQGELAVNVTDKRLFTEDNGGAIVELGTNPYNFTANYNGSAKLATTSTGIDVTGNMISDGVGIGTSSPSYPFHLSSSGDTVAAVTAGAASVAALNLGNSTNLADGGIRYDNSANALILRASNTERMRIDSSGNVGIGNTVASSMNAGANQLVVGSGSTGQGITLYSSTSTAGSIHFADGTSGSEAYRGQLVYNHNGDYMAMYTAATERLRIDSSGNVGIGESSPSGLLHLKKASDTADIILESSGGSGREYLIGSRTDGSLNIYDVTASAERMRIDSSGNLVKVGGVIKGERGTASAPAYSFSDDTDTGMFNIANADLGFAVGGSERMRIDASGNVGIGTSSPAAKLHVSNGSSGFEFSPDGISDGTSYMQVYDRVANSYDNLRYYAREHYFHCDNFEKMRLDNAGNLLVGTTSTSASVAGGRIFSTGRLVTSVNNEGHYFRRNSSDGSIVDFAKDGTTVGSIGAKGGTAYLIGSSKGLRVSGSGLIPITTAGANSDATYDIGDQAVRFKDLYLSGTGYFGTSVGIGTSSPAYKTQISDSGDTVLSVTSGDSNSASLYLGDSVATRGRLTYNNANDSLAVYTDNNERMRIDASGNLLVGTSNSSQSVGIGTKIKEWGSVMVVNNSSTGGGDAFSYYSTASNNYKFWVNANGQIAAIYTSIQSLSDQRFKENIRDLDDGLSKVMQLKPRKFDWKEGKGSDIKDARGFIAQEFEEVFPDLIGEWKDPAPEGEEPYKSVSQDLIPTLVKAIQEQQTLIESLTARIAALEE
jgi:hypothetical protein